MLTSDISRKLKREFIDKSIILWPFIRSFSRCCLKNLFNLLCVSRVVTSTFHEPLSLLLDDTSIFYPMLDTQSQHDPLVYTVCTRLTLRSGVLCLWSTCFSSVLHGWLRSLRFSPRAYLPSPTTQTQRVTRPWSFSFRLTEIMFGVIH